MNLKIDSGTFAYKDDREILKGIDLDVDEGELIAILGPNGAGKTTLLKCMLGLLKWTKGRTLINGTDLREIPERKLWQTVSYVPQAKDSVSPYSVEEMLLMGRSSHIGPFRAPGKEDLLLVEQTMERLHIAHLRRKSCRKISGGELQMVLIGRALVAGSDILVLDEPESNLDFKNQLIILETLESLSEEGKICLFNTHYPAHALQRASCSLLLSKDGQSLFGPTRQIITEENIEQAFGVRSLIRDIETENGNVRDVIPVEIIGGNHDQDRDLR